MSIEKRPSAGVEALRPLRAEAKEKAKNILAIVKARSTPNMRAVKVDK